MTVPATNSGPIVELSNRFERSVIIQHGKLGLTVAYAFEGICLARCREEGNMPGIVRRPVLFSHGVALRLEVPLLAIIIRFPECANQCSSIMRACNFST